MKDPKKRKAKLHRVHQGCMSSVKEMSFPWRRTRQLLEAGWAVSESMALLGQLLIASAAFPCLTDQSRLCSVVIMSATV